MYKVGRLEVPEWVLLETVKTQMKCHFCGISSDSALFVKTKSIPRNRNSFLNNNL